MNGPRQTARLSTERHARRQAVWGFALALILTLIPFALVHWQIASGAVAFAVIAGLALLQMWVQLWFFLHLGTAQKHVELRLLLFSALLLTIMLGGTLWIMASLALRMTG